MQVAQTFRILAQVLQISVFLKRPCPGFHLKTVTAKTIRGARSVIRRASEGRRGGGVSYYAHGRVQILQALPRGCLDILTNAARRRMGGQLTQAALLRDAEEQQDVRLGPRHVSQRMGKSDASCPETLRSCLPAAWAGIV